MSVVNDFPPEPILSLTPSLVKALRERTQTVLSYLVKANSISTYFNGSEILSGFRDAVRHQALTFQTFHDNVPLSVYEHYTPFVSRLLEKPCRTSSIRNLMAPGFPEFIAHSSGTTSGATKYFPKYRHPDHMSMSTTQVMTDSTPESKNGGSSCIVYSLLYRQVVEGLNDVGDVEMRMPVCLMTTGVVRMFYDMHVDRDTFHQTLKIPNQSSPLAASFIFNYKSFLFVHALFALYDPKVELINTLFTTIFRDFCRMTDDQWDELVECIDAGCIPELVTVGDLKDKLLKFLSPNPTRAAELRKIGQNRSPGWFTKIWPGLQTVIAISSGPFQMVVSEIRHYIGQDVELQTLGINCSEAFLALPYDRRDASLYKIVGSDDIVEFLPLDAPEDSKYVAQTWNVEVAGKYEVVLTTRDGLWRYRLGDIIEVIGFDPRDGQPVIHYVERRGSYIRLANEIVTGPELMDAIYSISHSFGAISEFCAFPDYREGIPRYGFFVELHGEPGSSPTSVPQDLHAHLQRHNQNYLRESQAGKISPPSVRVLQRGTFGEYRDWKIHAAGVAPGQVKVPTVTTDEKILNWLAVWVIQEF